MLKQIEMLSYKKKKGQKIVRRTAPDSCFHCYFVKAELRSV